MLEYIEGGTLMDAIKGENDFSEAELKTIMEQILTAVKQMHKL